MFLLSQWQSSRKRYDQSICYHGNCRETKIVLTVEEKNEKVPIGPINQHSYQLNINVQLLIYWKFEFD